MKVYSFAFYEILMHLICKTVNKFNIIHISFQNIFAFEQRNKILFIFMKKGTKSQTVKYYIFIDFIWLENYYAVKLLYSF